MHFRFTRMAVLVVGLALMTAACGRYSWSSLRSAKAFKDGVELYQKADYKAAIPVLEQSIAYNPDFQFAGFAYFYLGNSYDNLYRPARRGEPENDSYLPKAVEYYRKAIDKLATTDVPQAKDFHKRAYEYLISAYGPEKLNDFSQAEPIAKELISIEPNEPGNYQALARLYADQGMYDEAEAMYKKAIDVKPNDPTGYQLLAGYYNQQGEFDKTMDAFRQRADLEPNNPEAWHTIGTYHYDKVLRDKSISRNQAEEYLDTGLAAEDKALALNADYVDAVRYKELLTRLKANLERNPSAQKQLLTEADQLKQRWEALQAKQGNGGN